MTREELLHIHIYIPNKIDETIFVYFDLGFKIMLLINNTLSILYQSQVDYGWPFKDNVRIVPDSIITELQYQDLSATFVMCSRSELRTLLEHNCKYIENRDSFI